jgi:hypothetical protein
MIATKISSNFQLSWGAPPGMMRPGLEISRWFALRFPKVLEFILEEAMSRFKLRFDEATIPALAKRYSFPDEDKILSEVAPRARIQGYFTKGDFEYLCRWKTQRSKSRVRKNSPKLIEDATRIALSTVHEELRIGVLTLLHGVSWPTASVVLHFAHQDPYPIIDFRALWSLGIETRPQFYTFDYWWEYTQFCRELAGRCLVSMRDLDRALWQYSKENQLSDGGFL